uniref:CHCH domain-containing protein n=1 Tax=Fabrea salina TaxID=342563 RepID=A0A7S3IAK6_9CILI
MPRRSGGGMRSGGFSRSSGPKRSATSAAAPPKSSAQPARPGMMSGLGSTIMQGMAFGAGSEVAHQAVRGVMGGGGHAQPAQEASYQAQPQQQADPCESYNTDFMNCLQYNQNDIGACQSYLDLFKQCKGQF